MLLRPGTTCDQAIAFLHELAQNDLNTLRAGMPRRPQLGEGAGDIHTLFSQESDHRHALAAAVLRYDAWTHGTALRLAGVFSDPAVPARLRGSRYTAIVHEAITEKNASQITRLVHIELAELDLHFQALAERLRGIKAKYEAHRVRTLVLDTNDLLHYMRYDKIPWTRAFGRGTVVVIPHVVVDEIDRKAYATSDTIRRRARGVFELLEQSLTAIEETGRHVLPDGTAVEILLDEPGHVRAPNNDDEIVAQAAALQQAVAPTPITVVSGDNGMRARALGWGLKAGKLPEKYRIERLTATEKQAALASITFDPPE